MFLRPAQSRTSHRPQAGPGVTTLCEEWLGDDAPAVHVSAFCVPSFPQWYRFLTPFQTPCEREAVWLHRAEGVCVNLVVPKYIPSPLETCEGGGVTLDGRGTSECWHAFCSLHKATNTFSMCYVCIYIYVCVCMCALGVFHTYAGIIWHP